MPTAARSSAEKSPWDRARPTTSRTFVQISFGSCSTQPARGKICSCSCWPVDTIWPPWSNTIARVLVVPWSIAITYWVLLILEPLRCGNRAEASLSARPGPTTARVPGWGRPGAMPTYRLNDAAVTHARRLIDDGQIDAETGWSDGKPSPADGNA